VTGALRGVLFGLCAWTAACGATGVDTVPEGSWGGEHVAVEVTTDGAVVNLDCAHGAITAPLRLDPDGGYSLPGYYVRDVGPQTDPENRQPARYSGHSDGRTLTLSFTLEDGSLADGPFTAFLGSPAQLQQCRQ
jgi:hypothetical protein